MNSLQEMMNASLASMFESGKAKEIVDGYVEKMVRDAVSSATRPYSEFGKALEAKLTEHLQVDFEKIDFPAYNHLVTQVVQRALRHTLMDDAAKKLEADIAEMLAGETPKEITFSKLVEQLKEWAREDCYEAEGKYAVTASIDELKYGSRFIYLDPLPDKEQYNCRFRLMIKEDGTLSAAWMEGKDVGKGLFLGGLYGFERTIFQMYTVKTRLIIDTEEPDIYQPEGGEE